MQIYSQWHHGFCCHNDVPLCMLSLFGYCALESPLLSVCDAKLLTERQIIVQVHKSGCRLLGQILANSASIFAGLFSHCVGFRV